MEKILIPKNTQPVILIHENQSIENQYTWKGKRGRQWKNGEVGLIRMIKMTCVLIRVEYFWHGYANLPKHLEEFTSHPLIVRRLRQENQKLRDNLSFKVRTYLEKEKNKTKKDLYISLCGCLFVKVFSVVNSLVKKHILFLRILRLFLGC